MQLEGRTAMEDQSSTETRPGEVLEYARPGAERDPLPWLRPVMAMFGGAFVAVPLMFTVILVVAPIRQVDAWGRAIFPYALLVSRVPRIGDEARLAALLLELPVYGAMVGLC